jgi:NADPH2:quinone reductase
LNSRYGSISTSPNTVADISQKGDRVAAFHEMGAPGGSYAEYALAWDWTTFHLPDSTTFEGKLGFWFYERCPIVHADSSNVEAATIPLAALTAATALFRNLKLPTPWLPATTTTPLLIYGASSSVGSYAIKLARNSNIHPIIAVAGKGSQHVESMIDRTKGDTVLDYRSGSDEVVRQIREHLQAGGYGEVRHGLDPGIGEPSQKVLTEIVASDGAINLVLPSDFDVGTVEKTSTSVGVVHNQENGAYGPDASDLGFVTCRWFTRALQAGKFEGHPFEVRPGGLEGVEQALKDLRDGKQSAVKYVFRIAETPGL